MYYSKDTNVHICNNIFNDGPAREGEKVREARGSLEAMIVLGKYPPGEYVIHRKGMTANDRSQCPVTNSYTYGMTYIDAVTTTAKLKADTSKNGGKLDRAKLWVTRLDGGKVFTSSAGKPHSCVALSTATMGMYMA
jgi:hypothetical protein